MNDNELIIELFGACLSAKLALDDMTSEEFSKGEDKPIRDELERVVELVRLHSSEVPTLCWRCLTRGHDI